MRVLRQIMLDNPHIKLGNVGYTYSAVVEAILGLSKALPQWDYPRKMPKGGCLSVPGFSDTLSPGAFGGLGEALIEIIPKQTFQPGFTHRITAGQTATFGIRLFAQGYVFVSPIGS